MWAATDHEIYVIPTEVLMTGTANKLISGTIQNEHFDLLLEGTSIRGVEVIAALRDHLVNGLTPPTAYGKHEVSKAQFHSRLKLIQKAHDYATRISKFYALVTITGVLPVSSATPPKN
jgi:hypothetical protein